MQKLDNLYKLLAMVANITTSVFTTAYPHALVTSSLKKGATCSSVYLHDITVMDGIVLEWYWLVKNTKRCEKCTQVMELTRYS